MFNQQFDSFEELAVLVASHWDSDFRQLQSQKFQSTLYQAVLGPMLIVHARFGCHVQQRGITPAGMCSFAILHPDSPEMYWYGRKIGPQNLVSFPSDGEVDVFNQPGFSVFSFSFPTELLMTLFEQNGVPLLGEMLNYGNTVWEATARQLNRIRFLLNLVVTGRIGNGGYYLLEEIKDLLLSILIHNFDSKLPKINNSDLKKGRKFKQVIEHIHDSDQSILQISNICDTSQISIRTLQTLFKYQINMTPKQFLNGQRLYNVHKDLWHSDPSVIKVTEIANKWGFWHMGQFAADYQKTFAELPSDTLKSRLFSPVKN